MKLLLLCLFGFVQTSLALKYLDTKTLKSSHLQLIASNAANTRFIIRGPLPIASDKSFAFGNLTNMFSRVLEDHWMGTDELYLSVVSLLARPEDITTTPHLTLTEEASILTIENSFFNKYPKLGRVLSWDVSGDVINPTNLSLNEKIALTKTFPSWQTDQLWSRLKTLNSWLNTNDADICFGHRMEVIYIHDSAVNEGTLSPGTDARALGVSAAYQMRFSSTPIDKALSYLPPVTTSSNNSSNNPEPQISTTDRMANSLRWLRDYMSYLTAIGKSSQISSGTTPSIESGNFEDPMFDPDLLDQDGSTSEPDLPMNEDNVPQCPAYTQPPPPSETFTILGYICFSLFLSGNMVFAWVGAMKEKKRMSLTK